MINNTVLNKLQ